ncbi:MAG: hypothetical protein J6V53_03080 [Alphaproteobacteria bacterium]|nr:hypothetical protein [Alphaproteobacteria bacterium]
MSHLNHYQQQGPVVSDGPKKDKHINPLDSLGHLIKYATDKKEALLEKKQPAPSSLYTDIKVWGYCVAILASFGIMGYSCSQEKITSQTSLKNNTSLNLKTKERIKE